MTGLCNSVTTERNYCVGIQLYKNADCGRACFDHDANTSKPRSQTTVCRVSVSTIFKQASFQSVDTWQARPVTDFIYNEWIKHWTRGPGGQNRPTSTTKRSLFPGSYLLISLIWNKHEKDGPIFRSVHLFHVIITYEFQRGGKEASRSVLQRPTFFQKMKKEKLSKQLHIPPPPLCSCVVYFPYYLQMSLGY